MVDFPLIQAYRRKGNEQILYVTDNARSEANSRCKRRFCRYSLNTTHACIKGGIHTIEITFIVPGAEQVI